MHGLKWPINSTRTVQWWLPRQSCWWQRGGVDSPRVWAFAYASGADAGWGALCSAGVGISERLGWVPRLTDGVVAAIGGAAFTASRLS